MSATFRDYERGIPLEQGLSIGRTRAANGSREPLMVRESLPTGSRAHLVKTFSGDKLTFGTES